MVDGEVPLHVPTAGASSVGPPQIATNCCRSPLWYGIVALVLDLLPKGMTAIVQLTLYKEQFGNEVYWISTGSQIVQSLLGAPALAWLGYLSQPQRLGRRHVILLSIVASTVSTAVPALTKNAYIIISTQTLLALVGAGQMSSGLSSVISAWTTDWCPPFEKAKYFGITQGAMFGTFAVAPLLGGALQWLTGLDIFVAAFALKLLGPLYVLLLFPRDLVRGTEALTPTNMQQASSMASGQRSSFMVCKAMKQTMAAIKFLWSHHFAVSCCYMMINFTDAAVQDTIMLFLVKERHFKQHQVSLVIAVIGIAGCGIQCLGFPAAQKIGIPMEPLLLLSIVCMVAHFAFYSFVTDPMMIIFLEPIGAFGYVATVASMAITSGLGPSTAADAHDQGTLLGVLGGLRMIASCVGPLLIASLNTYWQSFPYPFHWAGVGFGCQALIMLPAVMLSAKLSLKARRNVCSVEAQA